MTAAGVGPSPDTVDVRLLGFPLDLYTRVREHYAELMREFHLLAVQPPSEDPGHDVPRRLVDLVDRTDREYGSVVAEPARVRDAARAQGRHTMDLVYQVPRSFGHACRDLIELLDEVDLYCRDGELLTLAEAADERRFRCWFLGEFVAQLSGREPLPWPDYRG